MLDAAADFMQQSEQKLETWNSSFPTEAEELPNPKGPPTAYGKFPEEKVMHPEIDEEQHEASGEEAVEINNWSDMELPSDRREDILAKVPQHVRISVRKSHRGLGHPSKQVCLNMLKLGSTSQAALLYARNWKCPTCEASAQPAQYGSTSTRTRPFTFNHTIVMDLKYLNDKTKQYVCLSIVDAGTSWHTAVFVKTRKSKHISRMILNNWIAHYGVTELIVVDQCGELMDKFHDFREEFGIDVHITAAQSGWQHGFAERHGGILGTLWRKIIYDFDIDNNSHLAATALAAIIQAKNATMTRNGTTPEQAVFGRASRWTENANNDDDAILLSVLGSHGIAWKMTQTRTAAKLALIERDAMDKVRRSMLRAAPTVMEEVAPGTRIHFWCPDPLRGRRRQDPERWRGPATVIARESKGSYYISWRGRVILVAREQIRLATSWETAAHGTIEKDLNITAKNQEDKSYIDISDETLQPDVQPIRKHERTFLKKRSSRQSKKRMACRRSLKRRSPRKLVP